MLSMLILSLKFKSSLILFQRLLSDESPIICLLIAVTSRVGPVLNPGLSNSYKTSGGKADGFGFFFYFTMSFLWSSNKIVIHHNKIWHLSYSLGLW